MAFEGHVRDFPEHGESREELLRRARGYTWYHTVQLTDDYRTPGFFDLDAYTGHYMMPRSLDGLRCLEIGSGSGYWSFVMEERGAASVLATDLGDFHDTDFSILHGQKPLSERPSAPGDFGRNFRVAASLRESTVEYKLVNCYDLREEEVGRFDLVWCGSMLMHLQGPQLALKRLAGVCGNTFIASTQTDIRFDGGNTLFFVGHEIAYVQFIPSPSCFANMLRAYGYERVLRGPTFELHFRDRTSDPICHTTCIGLQDADHPAIDLPRARAYADRERRGTFRRGGATRSGRTRRGVPRGTAPDQRRSRRLADR